MRWSQAVAELRRELSAYIERSLSHIMGWTLTASTSPVGDSDAVQTADEPTRDANGRIQQGQRPARRLEPWGLRGRPPSKVRTLWLRFGASNVVFIGIAPSRGYGPTDLEEGESALYCSKSGTVIHLDADGNVRIDAGAGADVIVNGGNARVARDGDSVNAGTVTATSPSGPVTFTYTTAGGVPQAPSLTLAMTGGQITDGADRFRA